MNADSYRTLLQDRPPRNLASLGIRYKTIPEDFLVEEVPAYPWSAEGQHVVLHVEKRMLTTYQVADRLALMLAARSRDIGFAGLKDKFGVTRQYFSVPRSAYESVHLPSSQTTRICQENETSAVESFGVPTGHAGWRILGTPAFHRNKIKTGHLLGNRFQVIARGLVATDDDVERAVRSLATGVPNYFGEQRFGRGYRNIEVGLRAITTGENVDDKRVQRLCISAVQSAIFNRILAIRIKEDVLDRVLPGDVLKPVDSRKWIVAGAEDCSRWQEEVDKGRLLLTGPIPGRNDPRPRLTAERLERTAFEELGLCREVMEQAGKLARGTRRPLVVKPDQISWTRGKYFEESWMQLAFFLPSGAYATIVLDEL